MCVRRRKQIHWIRVYVMNLRCTQSSAQKNTHPGSHEKDTKSFSPQNQKNIYTIIIIIWRNNYKTPGYIYVYYIYMYKNCTFVFQSISQDTCMMPSNVAAPLPEKKSQTSKVSGHTLSWPTVQSHLSHRWLIVPSTQSWKHRLEI